jgi:hypothetical protein
MTRFESLDRTLHHSTSHSEKIVRLALPLIILATSLSAQQPATPPPFFVGNRLGLPINPAADGAFE